MVVNSPRKDTCETSDALELFYPVITLNMGSRGQFWEVPTSFSLCHTPVAPCQGFPKVSLRLRDPGRCFHVPASKALASEPEDPFHSEYQEPSWFFASYSLFFLLRRE